ncbi:MAG: aspartate aminotransferase family protein [Bryobacteraceae bacterium]
MRLSRSREMLRVARRHLAGGVSSQVRAHQKPIPIFFDSASGSQLVDVDGNRYIDYTLAWGPLILGHCNPLIIDAVKRQLERFDLLGAQADLEASVAQMICGMVPCAELVAFSNSGTEAVQIAIRLARAFTTRTKVIRFEGHFHGWMDNMLSGYRPTIGPDGRISPKAPTEGFRSEALDEVYLLPWNDLDGVRSILERHGDEIAAIITEPIVCNCSCLMPAPGYLEGLRELASRYSAMLIFDEVITGFRVARGGAQSLFNITPDLAIFGKAVAGGFPLSVVAGRRDILELIEQGRVVHMGTFNGNPISLAAAQATLQALNQGDQPLNSVRDHGETLMEGIARLARDADLPLLVNGVGSAFHVSFTSRSKMRNYRDAFDCDLGARDWFIESMFEAGIFLLPDGRWYVSTAHTDADVSATLEAVRETFSRWPKPPAKQNATARPAMASSPEKELIS